MRNRIGMIVLILISVGLGIALIWNRNEASERHRMDQESVQTYSNKVMQTSAELDQQRQVSTSLEGDLKQQRDRFSELAASNSQLAASLEKTETVLKRTQDELAQRESKIAELENQNQALDERALDLSTAITNLTMQIEETRNRLAASEGDKAFLERELQRLMAEKAELERQFNDLSVLRAQVAKLREELSIARRIEWIRRGLFARAEQKGAEQLLVRTPPREEEEPKRPTYDLNVEIDADGTVRVIPPPTNSPAADSPQ